MITRTSTRHAHDVNPLPIDAALPELRAALGAGPGAVLQAPPGAGKTTRVPLALLDEPWLGGGHILLLEPRRLAARAAAWRMAHTLGERVGETVGWRMRMDTRVGKRTRIEVVTEGVLTRLIHADPALEGVGLVIFDEFHERSLNGDLGLALTLETRAILRPELRILVMSATLDGAAVAALLGGAPLVSSAGRAFPVEVRYRPRRAEVWVERAAAAAVRTALAESDGDVLVFLPGAREIRRARELLEAEPLPRGCYVVPLAGTMPQEEQDLAIAPSPAGRRKVVLATSIAETSLTIEGVRVVVDAGLARVPRFSPRTGMTRLETVRVSRASAEQRRGRAGRVAPGVCYRLWAAAEDAHLVPHATPEILEADLAPLALDLAEAGVRDPAELSWLDAPPAASFARARELLAELGALDGEGRITPHGRRMAKLAMHPRLAHMVLAARERGAGAAGAADAALACSLAALLVERDVLRGASGAAGPPDADVRLRLEVLHGDAGAAHAAHGQVDRDAVRRSRAQASAWREQLALAAPPAPPERAGVLLALAYPDRVAQRRPGREPRYLLRGGGGALLAGAQSLAAERYLVTAELDGARPESRILLAAPLSESALAETFGDQIVTEHTVEWDDAERAVRSRRRTRLGAIVLAESATSDADPTLVQRALLDAVARAGVGALPWSASASRLRERLAFLHEYDPARWPDVSDAALAASLDRWLAPAAWGVTRLDALARADLGEALLSLLPWERRAELDELAPTHVTVPSGSRVPIDYGDPRAPVLAVRLQEMFGLSEGPRIARGAVPLTLHLLSPARRPVQVTRDLAGFWRTTYFDVRKDLRGRYPKHHWPDDPMAAVPTDRARRRGE
ncbi:MAG TPA: ATP-dependent helicase HrpB [Gemmatimonadaceae bacterium]